MRKAEINNQSPSGDLKNNRIMGKLKKTIEVLVMVTFLALIGVALGSLVVAMLTGDIPAQQINNW